MLRDAHALWLAARDPRTPLPARLVAALVAAYALSPIDLIPDVLPVIGVVDDLIVVPLAIRWLLARLPAEIADAVAQRRNQPNFFTRR